MFEIYYRNVVISWVKVFVKKKMYCIWRGDNELVDCKDSDFENGFIIMLMWMI